jgi:hypothetical protein
MIPTSSSEGVPQNIEGAHSVHPGQCAEPVSAHRSVVATFGLVPALEVHYTGVLMRIG